MVKNFKMIVGSALILLILCAYAFSAAPSKISYQGMLKDADGDPVNGQYAFIAAIYDDSISTDPSHMLWQETHMGINVVNGLFQLTLGDGLPPIPITDAVFAGIDRWIGIRVQGGNELIPRTRFCSTPYSQRVQSIDGTTSGVITGYTEIRGEVKSVVGTVEFVMVPRGAIIMWSGLMANIPSGWALCDGTNGTPDLRNRFIYGCDTGQNPGPSGGALTHAHNVNIVEFGISGPSSTQFASYGINFWAADWAHGHTVDPPNTMSDPESSLPPYYKLAFIMKL